MLFRSKIGLVDELGSGVRNIVLYNRIYAGSDPKFIEGDIFTTIIPLTNELIVQETTPNMILGTYDSTKDRTQQILSFCITPKSRQEIQDYLGIKNRDYFRKGILLPLVDQGLLNLSIPDKPNSSIQRYYSSKKNN